MPKFSRVHRVNAILFVIGCMTLLLWQNCGNINLLSGNIQSSTSACVDDHFYSVDTSLNPLDLSVEVILRQTNNEDSEQYPGSVRWHINDQELPAPGNVFQLPTPPDCSKATTIIAQFTNSCNEQQMRSTSYLDPRCYLPPPTTTTSTTNTTTTTVPTEPPGRVTSGEVCYNDGQGSQTLPLNGSLNPNFPGVSPIPLHQWSTYGRVLFVPLPPNTYASFAVKTPNVTGTGVYHFQTVTEAGGAGVCGSYGSDVIQPSISSNVGNFDFSTPDTCVGSTYGAGPNLMALVTELPRSQVDPYNTGICILRPNTNYYINIRYPNCTKPRCSRIIASLHNCYDHLNGKWVRRPSCEF